MRLCPTMTIADKFSQLNSHAKHFSNNWFSVEEKVLNLFAQIMYIKKVFAFTVSLMSIKHKVQASK